MSLHLPPYPDTKDSGVEWLGQIPAHWELSPAFSELQEQKISNKGLVENQVLSLSFGKIIKKSADKLHGLVPASFETYQIANPGNVILRFTDLQNDQRSLRVGLVNDRGIITSAYLCLRAKTLLPAFVYYQLHSADVQKVFYGFGSGLRQSLSFAELRRMPIVLPPADEQAAIVRFLDALDRRVNRLLRDKRRLIGLLNEQKQAVIHHTVTKGLNPDAPMKPSGVEWLGDIPAHWGVTKLKHTSSIVRGRFGYRPRNDVSLYNGAYPFIQTGDVARATKFITTYTQTLNEKGLSVSKMFPNGTLVMTIAANIGDAAIMTFDACFPDSVVGFIPRGLVNREFLYLLLTTLKAEFVKEAPVNTQGNLNTERIGAFSVPLPKLAEQEKICAFVEQETAAVEKAVSRIKSEIDLIREYSTRLISDVVTGKVDVRDAVLPDVFPGAGDPAEEPLDSDETDAEPEDDEGDTG